MSEEAADLLSQLLTVDHNSRISAAEALEHPWFRLAKLSTFNDVTVYNGMESMQAYDINLKIKISL